MADVDTLIAASLARNEAFTQAAISSASDAMTAAAGRVLPPGGFLATVPALRTTPPVFSPDTDLSSDFKSAYREAFADFDPKVLQAVIDYIARFFPAALATVVDDWIQDAIVNGGTGIPPAIEAAIWARARSREIIDSLRLEQDAISQFAARGFLMPPGMLAGRLLEIQQDASNKISTLNRDVAIKAAEIEIANVRFAIENGLRVRLAVIQGIGDYIRAWMKPQENALTFAAALVSAKEKLWGEAANYYRALVDEARMNLEAQRISQISRDQMVGYDVQAFGRFVQTQTEAALAVAQVLGQAAAGALNATNASVGQQVQLIGSAP